MTKFPKTVYITRVDDDDEDDDFCVDTDPKVLSDRDEEGTAVAVYQLVKVGRVKKQSKIVFDE